MVPPPPIDLEIALRHAFILVTAFLQQPARGRILGQTCAFQTAQIKNLEGVMHQRCQRLAHETGPRIGLADPIADRPRLRRPSPDIVERDRPQDTIVRPPFQKERHRRPLRHRAIGPVNPVQKRFPRQMVLRPGRLPWFQKRRAFLSERRPLAEIGMDRQPKDHPFGVDPDLPLAPKHQAASLSDNASRLGAPATGP